MNIDRLINQADEGQLRTALHRVVRVAKGWKESVEPLDDLDDPADMATMVVATDITETITKELS